jgi:hypothetical protein
MMDTSTPVQFALRCCVLTLGIGLMLPDISWLRPLGLLVVIIAGYLPGGEVKNPKRSRFYVLLALIMAQVALGVLQSHRESKHPDAIFNQIFDIWIVAFWAWAMISDFRKRRART